MYAFPPWPTGSTFPVIGYRASGCHMRRAGAADDRAEIKITLVRDGDGADNVRHFCFEAGYPSPISAQMPILQTQEELTRQGV